MNAMYAPVVGIREEIVPKAGLLSMYLYMYSVNAYGYPVLYADFPHLYLSLQLSIICSSKQTFS